MIKVIIVDDPEVVFTGETEAEIVRQMKNTEWFGPELKREYMWEVADRVGEMTGKQLVSTNDKLTPAEFLAYLELAGMVKTERE